MPKQTHQDLIDARDTEAAMRAIGAGKLPTIPDEAMDAFLAAPTPLAFWRTYRGLTQGTLAEASGISHSTLAQLESGVDQSAGGAIYALLARRLGIRMEDLLFEGPPKSGNLARLPHAV